MYKCSSRATFREQGMTTVSMRGLVNDIGNVHLVVERVASGGMGHCAR